MKSAVPFSVIAMDVASAASEIGFKTLQPKWQYDVTRDELVVATSGGDVRMPNPDVLLTMDLWEERQRVMNVVLSQLLPNGY